MSLLMDALKKAEEAKRAATMRYIPAFAQAGSDLLCVHLEADMPPGIREALRLMEEHKVKKGIALRPITSAEAVLPWLEGLDLILVMTVEPEFWRTGFYEGSASQNQAIRSYIDESFNPRPASCRWAAASTPKPPDR